MRALASHECGLALRPHVGWACCWFSSLIRGLFLQFSSLHKTLLNALFSFLGIILLITYSIVSKSVLSFAITNTLCFYCWICLVHVILVVCFHKTFSWLFFFFSNNCKLILKNILKELLANLTAILLTNSRYRPKVLYCLLDILWLISSIVFNN